MVTPLQPQIGTQRPVAPGQVAWAESQNSNPGHNDATLGETKAIVEIGVQDRQCFFTRF
jgi:hypothetical protein